MLRDARDSDEKGIPDQTLIHLYLRDRAAAGKKLNLKWSAP